MNERNSIIGRIDWVTVLIYFALVIIGWFSIFSAKYDELHPSIFDMSQVYGKQLIWIGASLLVGFIILLIDAKFFNAFSLWIYIFFLVSLLAVLVYGKATKGATSWIDLGGGIKFQPSEFAKMATALALAGYLDRLDVDLQKRKDQIIAATIVLVPMALVLAQNDTGSAIVFVSFIFVLYREGFPGAGWLMVAGVAAILLFVFTSTPRAACWRSNTASPAAAVGRATQSCCGSVLERCQSHNVRLFDMSDIFPHGGISHISYIPHMVYKVRLRYSRRREAPQKGRYYDKSQREASGIQARGRHDSAVRGPLQDL